MPESVNGFGTAFYGKCDIEPDGSYITTEFNIILFVPFSAVASYRVKPVDQSTDSWGIIFSTTKQYMIKEVPLHKKQVRLVLAIAWSLVFGFIGIPTILPLLYDYNILK